MPGEQPVFKADFFKENRRRLRERVEDGAPIIIPANGLLQKSLDSGYPFRQDSNFWYLTGIDEPGLILVMDETSEYLMLPRQSEYMQTFDGEIKAQAIRTKSGVRKVYEFEEGWDVLATQLKKARRVAGVDPPQDFVEELGMYTNPARARLKRMILEQNKKLKFNDVKPQLSALRTIKRPEEIKAIKTATKATMETLVRLSDKLADFSHEYELSALAAYEFMSRNLDHAYEPIIAAGQNATTLHYVANNSPYKNKELILIDMGANYAHYASDLTRTIGVSPSLRQQAVHDAVNEIHGHALGLLKPGLRLEDFEKQVREIMGEKLRQLGLIKNKTRKNIRRYYPHATSHFVGLDVHDPSPKDWTLAPGMVVTVEPGIYIEEESIGVRIEDLVLIKERGVEVLSADLSRGSHSLTIGQRNESRSEP